MKIVCGSCQAKYSIADEKVAGKIFRIRCKRCDEVIVVRGDQDNPQASASGSQAGADTPQAPAEAQAPSDAIWHVVINGEQAGPYSPAQLGELVASGQLDWEAYVWAEGFENWLPMRDVPDLVSAISGEPAVAVSMGKPAATVANTQMGADPFPEEAQQAPQVAVFAKAAGAAGGGVVQTNLRAEPGPSALAGYDNPGPTTSSGGGGAGPRVSAQQAMTGARNENSVLFSLKNLQALATGSVPPGNGPTSVRPGHASGEGSGLIDIRALASTTGVAEPTRNSEKDALLALGSAQGGAFGALGSPMLAPAGKADDESSKKPLILAVIGGFALLAISGIAIAFILKGNGSTPAEVAPIAPSAAPPAAAATAPAANGAAPAAQPTAAAATPPEPPSEGELAAARAAKENEAAARPAEDSKPSGTHAGPAGGKRPSGPVDKPAEPAPVAAKPEPAPTKPADKPKSNSIDDLLNDAIGGKGNAVGAKSSAPANLPEKPSRDDVLNAMKGVTDAVKACSGGQPGVAFANVTVVGKTGMVANVDVTGVTGDVAPCIGKAVRKARFPKFSAENFQVKFPFRL